MRRFCSLLLADCFAIMALCASASALDYTFAAPNVGLFAEPTSEHTVYVSSRDETNIDRSKNAALIPPRFGSPTSYTLNAGELLTPNLVQQQTQVTGSSIGSGVTILPSSTSVVVANPFTAVTVDSSTRTRFTSVTSDLYYDAGHIGTLKIPAIGLSVRVYQGTDSATLSKGAGHFTDTSIWNGNVAIAAHNRGVNNHFGKLHTLSVGDKITLTTKIGSRDYQVYSVAKIAADDLTVLGESADNILTLVTCVADQPQYRWCVQARAT